MLNWLISSVKQNLWDLYSYLSEQEVSLLWLQGPAAKQLNVVHAQFFKACMNSILPVMTCHPQSAKYPSHLILLDLIMQIILGVYCNWQLLPVASCQFPYITQLTDQVVPMLHTAACVGSVWVTLSCSKCLSNCERMYASFSAATAQIEMHCVEFLVTIISRGLWCPHLPRMNLCKFYFLNIVKRT